MATRASDVATDPSATTTQPALTSTQLRKIAEAVAGYRGSPRFWLVLTQGPDGSLEYTVRGEEPEYDPNAVVIPCHTPKSAARPPLAAVTIQPAGGDPVDLLRMDLEDEHGHRVFTADAVFWGDSSVEKFVVPYYASVYGDQAGEAVTDLLDAYNGTRAGAARAEGAEVNATEVYGLVHIPRSEYIDMADDPAGGVARHGQEDRFAVLAFDPRAGRHRAITVEAYRKWRDGE